MKDDGARWFALRLACYMGACALMLRGLVTLVLMYEQRSLLRENGLIEIVQVTLLVLTFAAVLWRMFGAEHSRSFWALMAVLVVGVCFRELDEAFKAIGGTYIRKRGPIIVGVPVLIYCIVHRRVVWAEARDFFAGRSAMLMIIGTGAVLWGQSLGIRSAWKSFGTYESGLAKRMVEEGLETCGHMLIFAGAVEELFAWRRRRAKHE